MPLITTPAPCPDLWTRGSSQGDVYGCASDSNGNPGKVAFFGSQASLPVVQPSGNLLAAALRGAAAALVATFVTTQSPSAVGANTSAEKSFTVQTGTGATMLPATTDLFYVNKPTNDAGLGYGNVRVSSSNTLGVTFQNFTGGSLTPTASQAYVCVGIRGLPILTFQWSPAAVPANSAVEQQIQIVPAATGSAAGVGLAPGALVQVSKPTAQAGLDIVGVRVVSNNVLGVKFVNLTAAPIVPTAAETYTVYAIGGGIDAANNLVHYGLNVGTVGAIGAGIVATGGSTTLTGVLATDSMVGIQKPTSGAAATNAAGVYQAILTADTCQLIFFGIGTGATPTASEVYGIHTFRANPTGPLQLYTPTITPAAVAANTTAEQTFNVPGLIAGTPVWVNYGALSAAMPGLCIVGVRVSAASTLAVTFGNCTGAQIVPPSEAWVVGNFQAKTPGAGNVVYQEVSVAGKMTTDLTNAMRAGFGPSGLNLHAGA